MAFANDIDFKDDFRRVGADITATFEQPGAPALSTERASSENLGVAAKDDDVDDVEDDLDEEDDEDEDEDLEEDDLDEEDDEDLDDDDLEDEDEDEEDEDDDEEEDNETVAARS